MANTTLGILNSTHYSTLFWTHGQIVENLIFITHLRLNYSYSRPQSPQVRNHLFDVYELYNFSSILPSCVQKYY